MIHTTALEPISKPREDIEPEIPPLEAGDRLDQQTFHERYEAMPENTRAELIGGIVYMPSPTKPRHGRMQFDIVGLLHDYVRATPGVQGHHNVTAIIGPEQEPQPDVCLIIDPDLGGQMKYDEAGYLAGAPELVVEVASSTESIDLHGKKSDYESAGVKEYLVIALRQRRVFWFVLRDGRFQDLPPGPDGIYRSEIFPGLWLDPAALLKRDGPRLAAVLQQGLATPEHAAFAARLAGMVQSKQEGTKS